MSFTDKVTQVYDHYYPYETIKTILDGYQKKYPDYAYLDSIGKTEKGRDILLLKVTNLKTGGFEDKPAYFIEGNIHAGEVTGSMVVMYFLDTIFTNLEENRIQELLANYTIYAIPRLSPDGSEYYLTTPNTVRSVDKLYPYDSIMPGLQPCDLDGDGVIRKMRIKSPYGLWQVSDKDSRVMVKRRPDQTQGEFYNVYSEGMIEDFDGVTIKSAPQKYGNDFNRNYPANWEKEPIQQGAGYYPLSNIETKANADFLLNHPNICSVMDMHTAGGQILYTPGYKARKDANPGDMALIKAICEMGTEENGYPALNIHDEYSDSATDVCYGAFDDFCHFNVGVPSLSIECWDIARRAGIEEQYPPKPKTDKQQEEAMYKYLKWIDENLNGEGFMNWTPFMHPQLGEVEIGGFNQKYVMQNPPIPFLVQELKKNTNFFLRQIFTLPSIDLMKTKVEKISEDIYYLETYIINKGFLPTYGYTESFNNKKIKPIKVKVNQEVINSKDEIEIGHLSGYGLASTYNGPWGPTNEYKDQPFKKVAFYFKRQGDIELEVYGARIGKKTFKISE